ncbi:flagellar biosynthetic protein FliR, partial [Citrobacter braakii]|uniref:flagellar biosynthetic protein FliR n=1 Tax=Citrobacter braakii TaxID=57706 RepID=UPI00374FA519
SLYGSQEHLPVSQIVTVLDGEKLEYRIDPQSGQILVPEEALSINSIILTAEQFLWGMLFGLMLQFLFLALQLAGQILSFNMG